MAGFSPDLRITSSKLVDSSAKETFNTNGKLGILAADWILPEAVLFTYRKRSLKSNLKHQINFTKK